MKKHLFYLIIIAGLAVIIFLQRSCNGGKPCADGGKPKIDIKHDTVYLSSKGDSSYKPKPVSSTKPKISKPEPEPIYIPDGNYDSLFIAYYDLFERFTTTDSMYWELMQRYLTVNLYKDSINLNDKATGKIVATVYLEDSLRSNELWSRNYQYKLELPVINNTTTITIPPKPRFQLYAGIEAFGYNREILDAAGVNLMMKTKRDKVYTLHGGYNLTYRSWYGGLSAHWKIKLRK